MQVYSNRHTHRQGNIAAGIGCIACLIVYRVVLSDCRTSRRCALHDRMRCAALFRCSVLHRVAVALCVVRSMSPTHGLSTRSRRRCLRSSRRGCSSHSVALRHGMSTHTHIRARVRTPANAHTRTHAATCTLIHMDTCTAQTRAHACTHTCMHARVRAHTRAPMHTRIFAHVTAQPCMHPPTATLITFTTHTDTNTRSQTHSHAHRLTHTLTRTLTRPLTRTHSHTHADSLLIH